MKSVRISPDAGDASPLPSPPLSSIIDSSLTLSPVEVATAFHPPLNRFTEPRYLREHQFCGSILYWACNVTDLVAPGIEWSNAGADSGDEVGGGFGGRLETWGVNGLVSQPVHEDLSWRPLPIDMNWYNVVGWKKSCSLGRCDSMLFLGIC